MPAIQLFQILRALFCIFCAGLFVSSATCQDYKILPIADSISNPELGHFNAAMANPVLEGDYVVFRTLNTISTVANIWSWNRKTKQFIKLVDLSMPAPGGTGNFTDLNAGMGGPILKDGMVIFGARDSSPVVPPVNNSGVYAVPVTGGAIQRIANYNTAVPGGIGNFFHFAFISAPTGNYTYSDGVVGFEGDFGGGPIGNHGIYQSDLSGGNMLPIADSLNGIGDIFPIKNFTHVIVNKGRAAFIGGNVFGYQNLYSTVLPAQLGNYTELMNVATVLPGATGGFSFVLPSVRLHGDEVFVIVGDSTTGGGINRRTLYRVPFTGGAPVKIVSNFDTLEGLSSIEQSSISSYDLNDKHLMFRAKAPGTTAEQGLYFFDRSNGSIRRVFTLNQEILGRNFGILSEVQPGALADDSSRIVVSIAGSALFVGPFTYIAMLSDESTVDDGPIDGDNELAGRTSGLLSEIKTVLADARKALPPKPDQSTSKSKRAKIVKKRSAIQSGRKRLASLLVELSNLEKESGLQVRTTFPNISADSIARLNKFRKTGVSSKSSAAAARKAWKDFAKEIAVIEQRAI